jgi:hypothetical protein
MTTVELQTVDHDLIAAGHPRLSFEFHSYFQSLPPHWDRRADEQRPAGAFHYRSWLAGQRAQAEQLTVMVANHERDAKDGSLDFALLDCFACHHQLAPSQWRQMAARSRVPVAQLGLPQMTARPILLPDQPDPAALSTGDRLRLAAQLLARASEPAQATWDAAVQAYLGAGAIVADLSANESPPIATPLAEVRAGLDALGRYLSQDCFAAVNGGSPRSTAYDSPANFMPAELKPRLQRTLDAITKLQAALAAAP